MSHGKPIVIGYGKYPRARRISWILAAVIVSSFVLLWLFQSDIQKHYSRLALGYWFDRCMAHVAGASRPVFFESQERYAPYEWKRFKDEYSKSWVLPFEGSPPGDDIVFLGRRMLPDGESRLVMIGVVSTDATSLEIEWASFRRDASYSEKPAGLFSSGVIAIDLDSSDLCLFAGQADPQDSAIVTVDLVERGVRRKLRFKLVYVQGLFDTGVVEKVVLDSD